jgi:nitrogen regulatory protein P-II 1
MKEIKAFVHRNRIADVIHALKIAGFKDISVIDVLGMLKALDSQEQGYSIEIGEKVITEVKLELVCEAAQLDQAIEIIRKNGRTGQPIAGWVYVSEIESAYPIEDGNTS